MWVRVPVPGNFKPADPADAGLAGAEQKPMKHAYLAAALAVAACAPQPRSQAMDPPPAAAAPDQAPRTGPIPVRRFDERTNVQIRSRGGLAEAGQQVVRDGATWNALWARITRTGAPLPLPAVDFTREMVLVAAMGSRPTGGYTVTIEGVDEAGGEWVARVAEQRPGARCGTIQAVTAPVDAVAVPRSDRPVRWAVRQVVHDCP